MASRGLLIGSLRLGNDDGRSCRPRLAPRRWSISLAESSIRYVLYYHHQKGQFYAQGLVRVLRTRDEGCGYVCSHYFQNWRLNILVSDALDVSIMNWIADGVLCLSQICSGFDPMEYSMERKPDWYVFLNIVQLNYNYNLSLILLFIRIKKFNSTNSTS